MLISSLQGVEPSVHGVHFSHAVISCNNGLQWLCYGSVQHNVSVIAAKWYVLAWVDGIVLNFSHAVISCQNGRMAGPKDHFVHSGAILYVGMWVKLVI